MFAPDHDQSAAEMLRVCRPGGRIGLVSWTPQGFLGELFRTVAKHVPPMPGVRSPLLWGTARHLQQLFAARTSIAHSTRHLRVPVSIGRALRRGVPHLLRPGLKAFAALDANGQAALEADLLALLRTDRGDASGLVVPAEYLETVIVR